MQQLCNRLTTLTKVTLAMCKNENLHAREGCLHFVTSKFHGWDFHCQMAGLWQVSHGENNGDFLGCVVAASSFLYLSMMTLTKTIPRAGNSMEILHGNWFTSNFWIAEVRPSFLTEQKFHQALCCPAVRLETLIVNGCVPASGAHFALPVPGFCSLPS